MISVGLLMEDEESEWTLETYVLAGKVLCPVDHLSKNSHWHRMTFYFEFLLDQYNITGQSSLVILNVFFIRLYVRR